MTYHGQTVADHAIPVRALHRGEHARGALVRHALHEAAIKGDRVPLDVERVVHALKRKHDARVPVVGRIAHEVVDRLDQLRRSARIGVGKVRRQRVLVGVEVELFGVRRVAKKVLVLGQHILPRLVVRSLLCEGVGLRDLRHGRGEQRLLGPKNGVSICKRERKAQ